MHSEQLSKLLQDFVHTLVTDFSIQDVLDHLVEQVVDIVPVTGAAVTLVQPGSEPRATSAAGVVPYAREARLATVFTFPLRKGKQQVGALDLYPTTPGPLGVEATAAARTLADVAAAYVLNAQARVELWESSVKSRDRAVHDALTGLPNRILLMERVDRAVLRSRRTGKMAAILFVDLDRFKLINDLYGHDIGDVLLIAVSRRLNGIVRPGDTLARMSGDEFVILCEDLDGSTPAEVQQQVDDIAARVAAEIAAPFRLGKAEVLMTASVGIAFAGRGAQISEQVLHDADSAMCQAKRQGGDRHQVIDLREQHRDDELANLEHDLQGASTRGELRTEYQPIVETASGRIVGVEALVRWDHPSRGLIPPTVLVPLAEQLGLITEIGRWVLEQTCVDGRIWQHAAGRNGLSTPLNMSVNVSAHQLMSPSYVPTVAAVLSDTCTDPALLTLEVTESVFVQDSERALVVLGDLKRLGVKLALDDFGTGYSSLNYLRRFPIDVVKIDQSFVADMEHDRASHVIVYAVVELAHKLGMTVVAEGVETAAQHRRLATLGCDSCQGYYFARPVSASDLDTLMGRQIDGKGAHLPSLVSTA